MKEVEFISSKLQANQIVTYRGLSQRVKVPYANAKVILYNYFNKNRATLDGKLVIAGTKQNQFILQLVNEDIIDNEISQFDTIDEVFMYCISPKEYKYSASDLVLESLNCSIDKDNINTYYELGIIKGRDLVPASNYRNVPIKQESTKTSLHQLKDAVPDKKPKNTSTLLKSSYVSRKQEKRVPEEPPKEKYQYKSRKLNSKINKKDKVVISEDADSINEDAVDDAMKDADSTDDQIKQLTSAKTKLSDIFNDDEELQESEEPQNESEGSQEHKEPEMEVEDDEYDVKHDESIPEQPEQPVEPQYDEDGYLITYSKPKKPTAKKQREADSIKLATKLEQPQNKDKPKSKQPSVMSFFGKKKS